jgi:hypothetical protein
VYGSEPDQRRGLAMVKAQPTKAVAGTDPESDKVEFAGDAA